MSDRMLDDELLAELEAAWRGAGALYLDELPSGASEEQLDAASDRLGFPITAEARRWYRWHNGSNQHYVTSFRTMTTLEEDVDQTMTLLASDEEWLSGWLRAMNEQPFVIFDCRGEDGAPVPVWHYHHGFSFPTRPVFGSIGEMVEFWIELINSKQMTWSRERGWQMSEPMQHDVLEKLGGVPGD